MRLKTDFCAVAVTSLVFFTPYLRADTEADCKGISKRYEAINHLTTSGVRHYSWHSGVGQEEARWEEAEVWYDGAEPVKMRVSRGDMTFRQDVELYLKDQKIFFSFLRQEVFGEFAIQNKSSVTEERRYYKDDALLRCLRKERQFKAGTKVDMSRVENREVEIRTEPGDLKNSVQIFQRIMSKLPVDLDIRAILDGKMKP